MSTIQKKHEGGLNTKDLTGALKEKGIEESYFVKSHYLTTLIAIVGKNQVKQWETGYEALEEFVIPRSSHPLGITDNEGNQLWTVALFRKNVDSFKTKARSILKVCVRDCDYNIKAYEEDKSRFIELTEKTKTAEGELMKNCEIIYGALFECVMHIKVLRIHVECVLRWGVPPKYAMCAFRVRRYYESKLIGYCRQREES